MRLVKRQRKTLVKIVEAGQLSQEEWEKVDNDTRNALLNNRLVSNNHGSVVPTKSARQLVAEWRT